MFVLVPAVFDAYKKLSGSDIEDSIEGETTGNLENLLLAVGEMWFMRMIRDWKKQNKQVTNNRAPAVFFSFLSLTCVLELNTADESRNQWQYNIT